MPNQSTKYSQSIQFHLNRQVAFQSLMESMERFFLMTINLFLSLLFVNSRFALPEIGDNSAIFYYKFK